MSLERIKLSEHKKIGDTLHTPFTEGLGTPFQLTSWSQDRLPEYMWIALIIQHYGREKSFKLLYTLMKALEKEDLCIAEQSAILELPTDKQSCFYNIVDSFIDKNILSPLTIVLSAIDYPCFFEHYYNPQISLDEKVDILDSTIRTAFNFHAESTTDICFIVDWFYVINGHLKISDNIDILPEALSEYFHHTHDEEIMRVYRPTIRSTAQCLGMLSQNNFSKFFWKCLLEITPCHPLIIDYTEGDIVDNSYYEDLKILLDYLISTNKDKQLTPKYSVVMGIVTYALKLYGEIINNNLSNTCSGRIAFRSIVDAYINLKYLFLKESEQSDVFEMFQNYGIGKYKLVMAKLREGIYSIPENSHIDANIMESYVNELKDESFQEISLGYFDKESIKNKFYDLEEKELYDIYYEYDTNYTHAFWGAIRESSMLICDNPAHMFHSIPDYTFEQNLKSIDEDCKMILRKLINVISVYLDIPDFYKQKYEVNNV